MTSAMPIPALLQAISRLDQAVARAEAALQSARTNPASPDDGRQERVKQAIAELDGLIESLKQGDAHG